MHYCTHGPAVTMETEGGWIMQILSRRLTTRPHVLRRYPRANVGDCQLVHSRDMGGVYRSKQLPAHSVRHMKPSAT